MPWVWMNYPERVRMRTTRCFNCLVAKMVMIMMTMITEIELSIISREKRVKERLSPPREGLGLITSGCPHLPSTTCHEREAPGSF